MSVDALTQLQASVTKTSTFNGAGLTLKGGTPERGLGARILYSAATNASGSNTVAFTVDVSFDAGVSWNANFARIEKNIALSTTAQSGAFVIPFRAFPTSIGGSIQVRTTVTITGGGSTPTVTYQSDLVLVD